MSYVRPRDENHMAVVFIVVLAVLALLLGVRAARAQDTAPQANPAPTQTADTTPAAHWYAGGFVDVGYLKDFNDPGNQLFRARSTTPRVDDLIVNMAAIYAHKTATSSSRWGFDATLQGGEDSKTFGFSPTAPNLTGADGLRHLGPTDVSYLFPAGRGLTVQGGIFNSLVGYDSLYAKDNFTYTRPWSGDATPYLMLGVNVAYPFSDRVTATWFLVNSYLHLSHPNDAPSVGGQIAYTATPKVSVKQTLLSGPQQADTSLPHWRVFSDTIVERKAGRLTTAGELQLGTETVAETGERASWIALQFPVHIGLKGPWSVSVRPEYAHDPQGRYTGVQQTVTAITSGVEYRAAGHGAQAIARLEYRYDRSTGPQGGFYSGPSNELVPGQPLLVAGLILTFERSGSVKSGS